MKIKNILTPPGTEHKSPSWLKWVLILFVVYAFGQGYFRQQEKPAALRGAPVSTESPARDDLEVQTKLLDIKHKIFPETGGELLAKDEKLGAGTLAQCGQSVKLRYASAMAEGQKIEEAREVTFRLGDAAAMPALAQGAIGMSVGGERSVIAPYELSYGAPGQVNQNIPKNAPVHFTLSLLSVSPELAKDRLPLQWFEKTRGAGDTLVCGEKTQLAVTFWRLDGRMLFSETGLELTPGSGDGPLGLEQAVVGMRPGARRTVILPPEYQKTVAALLGPSAPPRKYHFPAIEFPAKEAVLVEVERLAAKAK